MNDELKSIRDAVTNRHNEWEKRTGKTKQVPFNGDTPCCYCQFNEITQGDENYGFACKYCIHNPEAIIWDLTDASDD